LYYISGPVLSVRSEDASPNEKTRDAKVRRTKAGYEPYQVKKKHTIPLIDTKSPNRTTQKGSPKENKSRKTSDEKERRNSRSHSSSKDTHSSNYYNNKKGHQSKPRHKNENQRRSDNKKLKPVVDLVEKNQKMKKVGIENLKVVKIVTLVGENFG